MNAPEARGGGRAGADQRSVVTVHIAGEEYTLRAHASPEYTRECAAYLDRAVSEILGQSMIVEPPKAVLLAALSLADQLFQARAEADALRSEFARLTAELAAQVDAAAGNDLAPPG